MAYKFDISKGEEYLLKAASIGAAVLGVVAIYGFYKNNLWKPKIVVKKVDYPNAYAELEVNGRPFIVRGDSSYLISYDWGIRLGFTPKSDGKRYADRIEVLKRNLVKDVLRNPEEVAFTGFNERTYWVDAFEGNTQYPKNFTGSEESIVNDVWGVKDGEGFSIFKDK